MGTTRLRHGDAVFFAAYTPDGHALLTAGKDRTVRLWDLATGQVTRRFDWGPAQGDGESGPSEDGTLEKYEQQLCDDTARSCQAALSANGKRVAASRGGVVRLWEAATGKPLGRLRTGEKRLIQLAFSADGKSLLTLGGDKAIAVWEVATGKCVRRTRGKPAESPYVEERFLLDQYARVSPGWQYLAFVRRDASKKRWIQIRDLTADRDLPPIAADFPLLVPLVLCFSADDRTLFWEDTASRDLVVWDVAAGKELRRLGKHRPAARIVPAAALALSADGKSLAVCRWDPTLECWDLTSGNRTVLAAEPFRRDPVGAWTRPALAFAPDGKRLVCTLGGAAIRQFQADAGKEIPAPESGHRWPVSALGLSADGKSLCTYSAGNPVRTWDWASGEEMGQLDVPAGATDVAFASDGRYGFAVGNQVTLCGAGARRTLHIGTRDVPLLRSLALSPDGALLATRLYLAADREVYLWDVATGKKRYVLGREEEPNLSGDDSMTEMTGVVSRDLVFSPDGRWLAGAGLRSQLCLWDTATGALLWELVPQAGQAIERFAFSPNGRVLASLNADRTVTLYEAVSGATRGRLGEADPKGRRVHLTTHYDVPASTPERRDPPVRLTFSPDGRYLATAQDTPEIHLWDVLAGREVGQFRGHEGGVVSLLWAADGRHLFSGGTDTTALTWDTTRLTRREPVHAAQLEPDTLDALWTDLAGRDAARAFEAMRKLSTSPDQALTLFRERVRPAPAPDGHRLARLVAELGSDRLAPRRRAESELQDLGSLAEPALRQALADDPPPDLRQRLERLLEKLSVPAGGPMRELRAVELLELMGGSDARQLLRTLAGGAPGARLTREARGALHRLANQALRP
jgi:WD40 repeat protein